MIRVVAVISVIFCWTTSSIVAQEKEELIQQRIEFIAEQFEDESIDLTVITEELEYFFEHPINLNNTTREQLQKLGFLTDIQIREVFLHIDLFGKFITIYELQSLQYWDMETIQLVLPFIKVDDKLDQLHVSLKEALKYGKFETFLRFQTILEKKAGYENVPDSVKQNSNKYYHGDANRYYSRLRFSYRTNLSVGITMEKDPGEAFFSGKQANGFDFYSAHAFYKGGKYLKAVALGDYQVQIGQGLNLWSGYAFGKSADVTNVKKSANSVKPYTSVDENRYLRGAAVELGLKKFSWTNFASIKQMDGAIFLDSLEDVLESVSSINLTGLHRTNSENDRKGRLQERIVGSNLRYENRRFQVGVAAIYQGYDKPFIKDTLLYNQFDFRGQDAVNISADYSWVFRNFNFFGETAYSTYSGGWANVHGVVFSMDKNVSASIVYRNYQRNYYSFYNAGFAEGSRTHNEKGIYAGLQAKITKQITFNSYIDLFDFPWLKYQVNGPSNGYEYFAQLNYKPARNLEVYARFRQQDKLKNSRNTNGSIKELESVLQRNYRVNFNFKVSEAFRLKSRVEMVTIDRASNNPERGIIFTQDIIFKPKSFPLSFAFRYALFDTDSYDSRIYTYENNALYVFSIPSYYYKGSRAYLMLRYKFFRKFDLWVRYGVFLYDDRTSIGSGSEMIEGNTKTDITVQLRMKL